MMRHLLLMRALVMCPLLPGLLACGLGLDPPMRRRFGSFACALFARLAARAEHYWFDFTQERLLSIMIPFT